MPWHFGKLQKKGLVLVVICIINYRSVTQQEIYCLNLLKIGWNHKEFQMQLET